MGADRTKYATGLLFKWASSSYRVLHRSLSTIEQNEVELAVAAEKDAPRIRRPTTLPTAMLCTCVLAKQAGHHHHHHRCCPNNHSANGVRVVD